jgi:SAM-dependent methyltransferase
MEIRFKNYDYYKEQQIRKNRRKLEQVSADTEDECGAIAKYLQLHRPGASDGICHGARNGFEVECLRQRMPGCKVTGTDIAPTATQFKNMLVWDFHNPNPAWTGKFDFVYSNSLDHAYDPEKAVGEWLRQLKPGGCCFITHSKWHRARSRGDYADCFSASHEEYADMFNRLGRVADVLLLERKLRRAVCLFRLFVVERNMEGGDTV